MRSIQGFTQLNKEKRVKLVFYVSLAHTITFAILSVETRSQILSGVPSGVSLNDTTAETVF